MKAGQALNEAVEQREESVAKHNALIAERLQAEADFDAAIAKLNSKVQEKVAEKARMQASEATENISIAGNTRIVAKLDRQFTELEIALSGIEAVSGIYNTMSTSCAFLAGMSFNSFPLIRESRWGIEFRGIYLTVLALTLGPLVSNLLTISVVTIAAATAQSIRHDGR